MEKMGRVRPRRAARSPVAHPRLTSLPRGAVGAHHLPTAGHLGAGRVVGARAGLAVVEAPREGVAIKPEAAALAGGTFCVVQAPALPCEEENGAVGAGRDAQLQARAHTGIACSQPNS